MVRLISNTNRIISTFELNPVSSPHIGEYINCSMGHFLVTGRTYNFDQDGRVSYIELKVSKV